jgi:lysophospholipase L1-like esterase
MEHVGLYDAGGALQSCGGLRPNATVTYTGWFFKIAPVEQEVNALGYRGPSRPASKPEGVFRIAAVGDSFTYGLGVGADEAIPARVEAKLRAAGRPVEVLNFGVPGSALADTVVRVREFAGRWSPDLVLFFLFADDLERPLCEWRETRAIAARLMAGRFGEVAEHPGAAANLLLGLVTFNSYMARTAMLVWRVASPAVMAARGTWSEALDAGLRALADASRPAPEGLAVVALGDPSTYGRSPVLASIMTSERLPWLDARGWLYGGAAERLPIIPGDQHFTAAGNDRAADAVAAWLLSQRLVPDVE